jgi:4-alpha-glucanotransferase
MLTRGSGILLHISSLPSEFGIGDLGPAAYRFVDFLYTGRQRYWQVLPLNPTSPFLGNSPYSSPSAFAGNALFLSPELLLEDGLLTDHDLALSRIPVADKVDYHDVHQRKFGLLEKAFLNFQASPQDWQEDFAVFFEDHAWWLEDYALFMILKEYHHGAVWNHWAAEIRDRHQGAMDECCRQFMTNLQRIHFQQFLFCKQWAALKTYADERQVRIIGDIPIYVSLDSADVWAHPALFKLKRDQSPSYVTGVPPDHFSATGQRWGNPVYEWKRHKETGYDWWMKRIYHNLNFFDLVRIDHFRGFAAFWQIPANAMTAVNGEWQAGPGDDFFQKLKTMHPEPPIIAEDLGIITPDVTAMMQRFGFPGMKVLIFAFNGRNETHSYIPENFPRNCVVYTGTHDNNTVLGWYLHDATEREKENLTDYLKETPAPEIVSWELIKLAMHSVADIALIPMQDILRLDGSARMNTPGTVSGNWQWRMAPDALTNNLSDDLALLTRESGRGVFEQHPVVSSY